MVNPYVPSIGAHVRYIESAKTSNWTRIAVGRTGHVVGLHVYSSQWGEYPEQGPRVLVLFEPETVERYDGKGGGPWHAHPCQVEPVE